MKSGLRRFGVHSSSSSFIFGEETFAQQLKYSQCLRSPAGAPANEKSGPKAAHPHEFQRRKLNIRERRSRSSLKNLSHQRHSYGVLLFVDLFALEFVFVDLAGTTLSWLTTLVTPSVPLATRSASVLASAVSTLPRRVTALLTTSTLIFLSGVLVSPISL